MHIHQPLMKVKPKPRGLLIICQIGQLVCGFLSVHGRHGNNKGAVLQLMDALS